jgi:hypothetical protein
MRNTSSTGRPSASSRLQPVSRVEEVDPAAGVGADDPVADRRQRDLGALALALEGFLRPAAVGDVDRGAERDQPAVQPDRVGRGLDPALAGGGQELQLEAAGGLLAAQPARQAPRRLGAVVGVDERDRRGREQLVGGKAGQRLGRPVDVEEPLLVIDVDRGGGGFRQGPEPRVPDRGRNPARAPRGQSHLRTDLPAGDTSM